MAINFPDTPSDGQVQGGFKYNSSKGVWEGIELAQTASVGDNAPTSPDNGDLWWDSSTGQMYIYYVDGSSNQWISISNPGGLGPGVPTVYANLAGFPSSGNSVGDFGIANDNKALYMWNGSAWTRANVGPDSLPEFTTTPASTHALNSDGTNTAITIVASDPEGFPITYSHITNPSSPNQVTNIVENNGVFTLVPSTNNAHAGNFTLKLKASDGVHIASHSIAVSLEFSTPITFGLVNSGSAYASAGADATTTSGQTDYTNLRTDAGGGIGQLSQYAGMPLSSPLPLGKRYFEFTSQNRVGYVQIGLIAQATIDAAGSTTNGENELVGYYENSNVIGNYHYNGSEFKGNNWGSHVYSIPGGAWGNGEIIMIAYDTDTRAVWFGNGGNWHATYNPLPGGSSSGLLAGGSSDQPRFYMAGASSGNNGWQAYTMRGDDLTYTPPSGYTSV